jgi:aspartate kinase
LNFLNASGKVCPAQAFMVLTQGFIARAPCGTPTTLGREGSDLTATLLGQAIAANTVVIFTDVPGMAFCDPRITAEAYYWDQLSYQSADLLGRKGAKVLHPKTMRPAIDSLTPVQIRQSQNPHKPGTVIGNFAMRPLEGIGLQIISPAGEPSYFTPQDYPLSESIIEKLRINIVGKDIDQNQELLDLIRRHISKSNDIPFQTLKEKNCLVFDVPRIDRADLARCIQEIQNIAVHS